MVPGISVCPVPAWSGAAAAHHMVTTRGSPWSRSTKQSLLGPINLLVVLVVLWELLDHYLQLFMQEEGTQHHARPQLGHSGHHLTTDGCGDRAQCLLGEQQVEAAGKGDLCKLLTEYGVACCAF